MDLLESAKGLYKCTKVYGPYNSSSGRKYCVVREINGRTHSKAYARVLMEVSLNRILKADEEVDHINGDCSCDDLCNLQVISRKDHRLKSGVENSIKTNRRPEFICPNCSRSFKAPKYRADKTDRPCCSRSCASQYHGANGFIKFGTKYK